MQGDFLETENAIYWLEDGIVFVQYKSIAFLNLDVAKKIVEDRIVFTNGKTLPIYVDIRSISNADSAARKYLSGKESIKNISAGAIMVDSYVSKFLGNIFLTINKPSIPSKLFTDKHSALKWLHKFK